MSIPQIPVNLPSPIAVDGDRNTLPVETPVGSGNFSYNVGAPSITSQPKKAGGIPPSRLDFNGVFYVLSSVIHWLQSGLSMPWNNANDYPKQSIVSASDSAIYIALADNGANYNEPQEPQTSPTYWLKVVNSDGTINIDALSGIVPVSKGGTGAVDAVQAWANLGGGAIGKLNSLSADNIPALDASKVNSGVFQSWQIPGLDASKITSGVLPTWRGGTGTTAGAAPLPTINVGVGQIIRIQQGAAYTVPSGTWLATVMQASTAAGESYFRGSGIVYGGNVIPVINAGVLHGWIWRMA